MKDLVTWKASLQLPFSQGGVSKFSFRCPTCKFDLSKKSMKWISMQASFFFFLSSLFPFFLRAIYYLFFKKNHILLGEIKMIQISFFSLKIKIFNSLFIVSLLFLYLSPSYIIKIDNYISSSIKSLKMIECCLVKSFTKWLWIKSLSMELINWKLNEIIFFFLKISSN